MKGINMKNWKFPVIYTICVILAIVAICLAFYLNDEPKNIANDCVLFLGVVGIFMNAVSLLESIKNNKKEREIQKAKMAFDLLKQWDDEHYLEARDYTRAVKKERSKISDDELIKQIDESEDLERSVILVLNYFEQIHLAIEQNLVDEELIGRHLGAVMTEVIERFDCYWQQRTNKATIEVLSSMEDKFKNHKNKVMQ